MSPVETVIHVSPSGLERAWACTGFPFLNEGVPKPPQGEAASKGQLAHSLVLGAVLRLDAEKVLEMADSTDCTYEDALNYHGHATALIEVMQLLEMKLFHVERKMPALQELGMVPTGREGEHQADLVWFGRNGWNILDYKSGKGPVQVIDNKQLLAYAWAWMKEEGKLATDERVNLWVYQPLVNIKPQCWSIPMAWVARFGAECAGKIVEMEEGGQLAEGPHCTWCPVERAGACPLKQQGREKRKEVSDTVKTQGAEVTQALSEIKTNEQKVGEILNLPKSAEDISIPDEVRELVESIIAKEKDWMAVDKGNADEASECLKLAGTLEGKLEDSEMLIKKPYSEAKKAVEDAFRGMRGNLKAVKASLKAKIDSYLTIENRKREAEIQRQKDEQDRIAKELAEKEAKAAKLKGAAAAKAEAEAQELRNKAAEASVVHVPPEVKVSGVSSKKVWTFDIPDVTKIPERYLLKHEGMLTVTGTATVTVLEVDFKTMSADATAGRLEKANWLKVRAANGVSAR